MPPQRAPEGVFELISLLWELYHRLQSGSKLMQARLGVTGPQRIAIRIIGRNPGITAGELARALHLHPSTLTGILRRLASRGIVTRALDPADARRVALTLTDRGRAHDRYRVGTIEHAVSTALARMDPEDLASSRRVIRSLVAALEAERGTGPRPGVRLRRGAGAEPTSPDARL